MVNPSISKLCPEGDHHLSSSKLNKKKINELTEQ